MLASTRVPLGLALALAAGATLPVASRPAEAATLQTLHTFSGAADGSVPIGDLVLRNGMIFGTTSQGGTSGCIGGFGCGTIFELDPATGSLTTIYSFTGNVDGGNPRAGVVFDKAGKIYGTTYAEGTFGFGTVFQFDPASKTLTTLHSFTDGKDGARPWASLAFGDGRLYGTASDGGSGFGTLFEIVVQSQTLTVLHTFCSLPGCTDGAMPFFARLAFDPAGKLYGVTSAANGSSGTLFQIDPKSKAFTTLRAFPGGSIGNTPMSGVVIKNGHLFGTTSQGNGSNGTVYKLYPATRHLETLYAFGAAPPDGGSPFADLTPEFSDASGVFFGSTGYGGTFRAGTLFKLNAGRKKLTILHDFTGGNDGNDPEGGMALDHTHMLYGSTAFGGNLRGVCVATSGCGTVFRLSP